MSRVDQRRYKSEHRHDKPGKKPTVFHRFVMCVTAMMLAGLGIGTLLKGQSIYPNWRGEWVSIPVTIVLMAVVLLISALLPNNSARH